MTSTPRAPRADLKLDEAEFFLAHLRDAPQLPSIRPDAPQAFAFYLSAFLNAGYSCQEVLELEVVQGKLMSPRAFKRWRAEWEGGLAETEARIWKLGREERRHEVHLRGAKTAARSGLVAAKARRLWRGGIYGSIIAGRPAPIPAGPFLDDETAAALAGLVPLEFATIPHFKDKSGQLEVIKTCTRYVALLRRHVADCQRRTESEAK